MTFAHFGTNSRRNRWPFGGRIVALSLAMIGLWGATPAGAENWRSDFRRATEILANPEAQGDEETLKRAKELLESADASLAQASEEARREAAPYMNYNRGLLALREGDAARARELLSAVYDGEHGPLYADARYNLATLGLAEAVARHRRAAAMFDSLAAGAFAQIPPEAWSDDAPTTFDPADGPPKAGQVPPGNARLEALVAAQEQAAPPADASAGGVPDLSGGDPAEALKKEIEAARNQYAEALRELRIPLRADAQRDDASFNYELTLRGREEAERLEKQWKEIEEKLAQQQPQQQQSQGDQNQEQQDQQSSQDQRQSDSGQQDNTSQQQGDESSQARQQGEEQQGEKQQQYDDQGRPKGDQGEQQREEGGAGEQREANDEAGEDRPEDANKEGSPDEFQQPDPAEQKQSDQEEPDVAGQEQGEGEQRDEDPIDPGPERGVGEQPLELDDAMGADPMKADPAVVGEEGKDGSSKGAAAASAVYGMTPRDARLLLQSLDERDSRLGRINFLRAFRQESISEKQGTDAKTW